MPKRRSLSRNGSLKEKLDNLSSSQSFLNVEDLLPSENQPRRYFDEAKLAELELSIKEYGVLEPVLVRPINNEKYELVAGERRYRAAIRAGLNQIPVVVRDMSDIEATRIALVENLQREDLNPFEETEGVLMLISSELDIQFEEVSAYLHSLQHQLKNASNNVIGSEEFESIERIFSTVGKMTWESFINNRLPILNLPEDILLPLRQGKLAYTKARAIAQLDNPAQRQDLLQMTLENELSLAVIKNEVKRLKTGGDIQSSKSDELKKEFSSSVSRLKKSNVWHQPSKQKKIEKLLADLNKLIE